MVNDWKTVGLGEISEFSQGLQVDPKDQFYEYEEGMVRFIRIIDFTNPSEPVRFINCTNDRYMVNENDIVMIRYGSQTAGKVVKGMQGVIANNMFKINILSNEVERSYLYHFLSNRQVFDLLRSSQSSSTMPAITFGLMKSLEISYPPIPEQKAIAHILGTLDDKIELNRKMNETLEAMAQTLFKSWFVDFDPVIDNALLAGKTIPEPLKERAEMRQAQLDSGNAKTNPEINDLFPSEFEFTEELGWIPKGWSVDSVDNLIEINPRLTLKKGALASHADMKALPESGFNIDGVIEKEYSGGTKFQNRDVLFARITPCLENGKTGLVDFLEPGEVGFGSTEFIVLREKDNITMEFVACLARNNKFRLHAIQSMVGSSGRQRVQNSCFSDFYMALPKSSNKVLELFHEMTSVNFEKISIQAKESRTLAKLRDTLLPKLMSGELRIADAEKLAENI